MGSLKLGGGVCVCVCVCGGGGGVGVTCTDMVVSHYPKFRINPFNISN